MSKLYFWGKLWPAKKKMVNYEASLYWTTEQMKIAAHKVAFQGRHKSEYLVFTPEHTDEAIGKLLLVYVTDEEDMGVVGVLTEPEMAAEWGARYFQGLPVGLSPKYSAVKISDAETNKVVSIENHTMFHVSVTMWPDHGEQGTYLEYATTDGREFWARFRDYALGSGKVAFLDPQDRKSLARLDLVEKIAKITPQPDPEGLKERFPGRKLKFSTVFGLRAEGHNEETLADLTGSMVGKEIMNSFEVEPDVDVSVQTLPAEAISFVPEEKEPGEMVETNKTQDLSATEQPARVETDSSFLPEQMEQQGQAQTGAQPMEGVISTPVQPSTPVVAAPASEAAPAAAPAAEKTPVPESELAPAHKKQATENAQAQINKPEVAITMPSQADEVRMKASEYESMIAANKQYAQDLEAVKKQFEAKMFEEIAAREKATLEAVEKARKETEEKTRKETEEKIKREQLHQKLLEDRRTLELEIMKLPDGDKFRTMLDDLLGSTDDEKAPKVMTNMRELVMAQSSRMGLSSQPSSSSSSFTQSTTQLEAQLHKDNLKAMAAAPAFIATPAQSLKPASEPNNAPLKRSPIQFLGLQRSPTEVVNEIASRAAAAAAAAAASSSSAGTTAATTTEVVEAQSSRVPAYRVSPFAAKSAEDLQREREMEESRQMMKRFQTPGTPEYAALQMEKYAQGPRLACDIDALAAIQDQNKQRFRMNELRTASGQIARFGHLPSGDQMIRNWIESSEVTDRPAELYNPAKDDGLAYGYDGQFLKMPQPDNAFFDGWYDKSNSRKRTIDAMN